MTKTTINTGVVPNSVGLLRPWIRRRAGALRTMAGFGGAVALALAGCGGPATPAPEDEGRGGNDDDFVVDTGEEAAEAEPAAAPEVVEEEDPAEEVPEETEAEVEAPPVAGNVQVKVEGTEFAGLYDLQASECRADMDSIYVVAAGDGATIEVATTAYEQIRGDVYEHAGVIEFETGAGVLLADGRLNKYGQNSVLHARPWEGGHMYIVAWYTAGGTEDAGYVKLWCEGDDEA